MSKRTHEILSWLLIACALGAAGCNRGGTFLRVTVTSGAPVIASRLDVTTTNGGQAAHDSYQPPAPFGFPQTFSLEITDGRQGPAILDVIAIGRDGEELARGSGAATITSGQVTNVAISLGGAVDAGADAAIEDSGATPADAAMLPLAWTRGVPFDQNDLLGIWGSGPANVFIVGATGGIWRSTAPGSFAFAPMTSTVQTLLHCVWGSSPNDVYVVGDGGVILHWDGRAPIWAHQVSNTTNPIFAVWGSGPGDVWAVGGKILGAGMVLHTANAGGTWASSELGANMINAVWGSGPADVFAAGDSGSLFHFDGANWLPQGSGTQRRIWGIWGSSPSDVYMVGEGATIIHTSDHGAHWVPIAVSGGRNLTSVWGTDAGHVYAAGDAGTVIHLSEGGAQWQIENPVTQNALQAIWGSGERDIYAVGLSGTVIHGQ